MSHERKKGILEILGDIAAEAAKTYLEQQLKKQADLSKSQSQSQDWKWETERLIREHNEAVRKSLYVFERQTGVHEATIKVLNSLGLAPVNRVELETDKGTPYLTYSVFFGKSTRGVEEFEHSHLNHFGEYNEWKTDPSTYSKPHDFRNSIEITLESTDTKDFGFASNVQLLYKEKSHRSTDGLLSKRIFNNTQNGGGSAGWPDGCKLTLEGVERFKNEYAKAMYNLTNDFRRLKSERKI